MKISDYFKMGINPATSYILGLSYPMLKIKQIRDDYYILGCASFLKLRTIPNCALKALASGLKNPMTLLVVA